MTDQPRPRLRDASSWWLDHPDGTVAAGAMAPDRLLTTREVAELLGLSPEAVLRRWRAGELPGFRLSSKVLRFRESEILAWLEARRDGPEPPRLHAV